MPAASLRPFISGFNVNADSVARLEKQLFGFREGRGMAYRKLKYEQLLQVDSPGFHIGFDPLFLFEFGPDLQNKDTLFRNTRGVRLTASIGKSFYLETSFLENQARYPEYVRLLSDTLSIFPQQGRAKPFKRKGADFAMAWGSISWKPLTWLMIRAGHDKFFVGNGYRSLLLSDNAFVMPFAQVNLFGKKWSYTSVWSNLQTLRFGAYTFNPLSEPVFSRKGYSFQYLTYQPVRFLEAGLFFSTIWTGFPTFMASPVPTGLLTGSTEVNNITGINLSARLSKHIQVYGQAVYNGKQRNGFQAGIRSRHTGGIKNLNLLAEYNRVSPYTYQGKSLWLNDLQGYHHYNQSLTHPLGAHFQEWVGMANYRFKDFFFRAKLNYYEQWRNGNTVLPIFPPGDNNITLPAPPPLNTRFGEGQAIIKSIKEFNLGFIVNRKTNLSLALGTIMSGGNMQSNWFNISVGTRLWNQYIDF